MFNRIHCDCASISGFNQALKINIKFFCCDGCCFVSVNLSHSLLFENRQFLQYPTAFIIKGAKNSIWLEQFYSLIHSTIDERREQRMGGESLLLIYINIFFLNSSSLKIQQNKKLISFSFFLLISLLFSHRLNNVCMI